MAENHNDKYPVDETPAAHPPDTCKETAEAHKNEEKKRVWGLTPAKFRATAIVILAIAAGAIGGGIGASLSRMKSEATRPKVIAGASTGSSSATATPTSTSTKTSTTATTSSPTSTAFVPQNKTYAVSELDATAQGDPIATLTGNVRFVLQNDNNFVVYNTTPGEGSWTTLWKANHTVNECGSVNDCKLEFGGDGNLIDYVNDSAVWETRTAGVGEALVFMNLDPWVVVLDGEGREVWRSWDGVVEG